MHPQSRTTLFGDDYIHASPLPAFPLRLLQVCSDLRLHNAAAHHEEVVGQTYIGDMEQARCVQRLLPSGCGTPLCSQGQSRLFRTALRKP